MHGFNRLEQTSNGNQSRIGKVTQNKGVKVSSGSSVSTYALFVYKIINRLLQKVGYQPR